MDSFNPSAPSRDSDSESWIPGQFPLSNPGNWHSTCRSLLERTTGGQDLPRVAQDLAVDLATADYLVSAAKPFLQEYPGELKRGNRGMLSRSHREFILRADRIGKGMYEMARQCLKARFFVRDHVLLHAVRTRHRKMLTLAVKDNRVLEMKHSLDEAKSLELFVRELGLNDLMIGLVAPEIEAASLAAVRRKLALRDDIPVRIHRLRTNRRIAASTELVGVEVVRRISQDKAVVDPAFESVMAWAAAIEPWRFFAP